MTATGVAVEPVPPTPAAPVRTPWWRRFTAATVPPLVALVAGWLLLAYRTGRRDEALLRPSQWGRWDTGQYLKIARSGYEVTWQCSPRSIPPHAPPGHYLCGNAGWFPGYPGGIRLLSDVAGLSLPMAALVLSWVCWYLALLVMWQLLAGARSLPSRWLCLLVAAFFPGQVYFAALFPVSLCVAAMLACLYAATRPTRPLLSGGVAMLAGAAAAYTYITPIALAPALLLTALIAVRGRRRLQVLAGATGILAGFGGVLVTMQLLVGIWNAYFLSAAKFGVGAHSPLDTLKDRLQPLWVDPAAGREVLRVTASQTLLTLGLLALATVVTLVRAARPSRVPATELAGTELAGTELAGAEPAGAEPGAAAAGRAAAVGAEPAVDGPAVDGPADDRAAAAGDRDGDPADDPDGDHPAPAGARRPSRYARWYPAFTARISPRDLLLLLSAGGVWLVPYIAGGGASTYRSEAFVVLCVPLLRRLPPWLLMIVLAAVVSVTWRLAPYFFDFTLA
ncbi:MAG TPA: hypothetical protein VI357_26310 [Mycobacteriales bacterium]